MGSLYQGYQVRKSARMKVLVVALLSVAVVRADAEPKSKSDADAYTFGQIYHGLPVHNAYATGHPHNVGVITGVDYGHGHVTGYGAIGTMGKEKLTLMPSQMLMPTHSARSTMVCQYIMLTPLDTLTMLELSLVSITGMGVYLGMELLGTEVTLVMDTLVMLIMDTMDIMANVKLTLMPSLMPIQLPRSTMGSLYTMHMPLDIHTMLGLYPF